jgi:hypothetical protein
MLKKLKPKRHSKDQHKIAPKISEATLSMALQNTTDIQTMKSLQASSSATYNGIDLGPFGEDKQDAFRSLISQMSVSLSPVTVKDNYIHSSIPGIIEVVQDPKYFFPMAKLGVRLFLPVQAGQIWKRDSLLDNLGHFRPVHLIYSALDVIRDDPQQRLHDAIVKAEALMDCACYQSLFHRSNSKNQMEYCQLYLNFAIRKGWPFDIIQSHQTRQATLLDFTPATEQSSVYLLLRICPPDCVIHQGVSNQDIPKFCDTSCVVSQLVSWQTIADQQPRNENQSILVTLKADGVQHLAKKDPARLQSTSTGASRPRRLAAKRAGEDHWVLD